jgi:hypothetical protein
MATPNPAALAIPDSLLAKEATDILRDELLNETLFTSLAHARERLGCLRERYQLRAPRTLLQ